MLNQNTKAYYLPNDPDHIFPLTHDDYVDTMREHRKLRKRLERIGECNAPFSHQCTCDCVGCPYRTNKATVSLDNLLDDGYEPVITNGFEEHVLNHIVYQQAVEALYKVDLIDRIIIQAQLNTNHPLSNEQTAALISKAIGRYYSEKAVMLRFDFAVRRLREVMGIEVDD